MRMLPLFALLGLVAAPALAAELTAAEIAGAAVMPQTPSGEGDPAAVVCRAPQPLRTGGLGPKICMHNEIWARLTLTGTELNADGTSVFVRATVAEPSGNGHPDNVVCRRPAPLTASRVRRGPEVCLTNSYWKKLAEENMRVDAGGMVVSTLPTGPANGPDGFPTVAVAQSPAL